MTATVAESKMLVWRTRYSHGGCVANNRMKYLTKLFTPWIILLAVSACSGEIATVTPLPAAPTSLALAAPTRQVPATAYPVVQAVVSQQPVEAAPSPAQVTGGSDLESYPAPATPASPPLETAYPAPTSQPNGNNSQIYLPFAGRPEGEPTPTMVPTPTEAPSPTPRPTIDTAELSAQLAGQGRQLSTVKMGFHVTLLENRSLLDDWMQALDSAKVPFFLKTVDNAEPLYKAQQLMASSGVPHTLVYRSSGSVPHYELPAAQAAEIHWTEHKDKFPAELDPDIVWIETLNEPDRTRSEWLGQFALRTAELAQADGFRWAAFGWASGEPEIDHWQSPSMLAFLRLAAERPDRLAIAIHEYSFLSDDIGHEYPYKVGRFLDLFRVADENGFSRPTVLITEWGWEYADVPDPNQALKDIRWASELYAGYPEIKGAALWNLGIGCCFDDISDQAKRLVDPLLDFSLTEYFSAPLAPDKQSLDPAPFQP